MQMHSFSRSASITTGSSLQARVQAPCERGAERAERCRARRDARGRAALSTLRPERLSTLRLTSPVSLGGRTHRWMTSRYDSPAGYLRPARMHAPHTIAIRTPPPCAPPKSVEGGRCPSCMLSCFPRSPGGPALPGRPQPVPHLHRRPCARSDTPRRPSTAHAVPHLHRSSSPLLPLNRLTVPRRTAPVPQLVPLARLVLVGELLGNLLVREPIARPRVDLVQRLHGSGFRAWAWAWACYGQGRERHWEGAWAGTAAGNMCRTHLTFHRSLGKMKNSAVSIVRRSVDVHTLTGMGSSSAVCGHASDA